LPTEKHSLVIPHSVSQIPHLSVPYAPYDLAIIGLIMTLGSLLQGALGFASGLVGVPLLILCGFPILDATVINFISTAPQNIFGAMQLSEHLEWREVVWPTTFRALGLPMGFYALEQTRHLDQGFAKQIIGAFLLASVLLLVFLRVRPRDQAPLSWTVSAFLSSGFLMGFGAIGGAPMVVYVNNLTWSAAKSRGVLFFCSAALVPFMAAYLLWKYHADAASPATAAVMIMPTVLIALFIGLRLGHRLDKARFRRITYALLVIISIFAIASPLFTRT
jgi:uncharacterized membrane protein YfcA